MMQDFTYHRCIQRCSNAKEEYNSSILNSRWRNTAEEMLMNYESQKYYE
jgi:hypothetical protein